jgi:hypothetical protein
MAEDKMSSSILILGTTRCVNDFICIKRFTSQCWMSMWESKFHTKNLAQFLLGVDKSGHIKHACRLPRICSLQPEMMSSSVTTGLTLSLDIAERRALTSAFLI